MVVMRFDALFRFVTNVNDRVIIEWMIKYNCSKNHSASGLCEDCSSLLRYATIRIEKCPYGDDKPVCSNCTIHCYIPEKRGRIKDVMKFSGPAIIFRKPLTGIRYILKKKLYKPVKIKNP